MIHPSSTRHGQQRGAAALITVMVLVLVMSVVFAFANRSLIFEQRTSANQLRSTQALETAEAGLEWTLARLNDTALINGSCTTSSGTATYSSRYLTINATTGIITANSLRSACVIRANGTLQCGCPTTGNPAPTGVGNHFSIEFTSITTRPDLVRVTARGCTDTGTSGTFDSRCLANGSNDASDGFATASLIVAQIPAVYPSPKAALTAKGNVNWQGAGAALTVANTAASTNGITINAGGSVEVADHVDLISVPGTPQGTDAGLSVVGGDATLSNTTGDQYFLSLLGTSKNEFYNSDKAAKVPNNTPTEWGAVGNKRMIWVGPAPNAAPTPLGNYELPPGDYGSAENPVVIVVNGNLNISGNTTIYGVIYAIGNFSGLGGGNSLVQGAALTEGNYADSNGTRKIIYDPAVLARLWEDPSLSSFTKLPGSWTD